MWPFHRHDWKEASRFHVWVPLDEDTDCDVTVIVFVCTRGYYAPHMKSDVSPGWADIPTLTQAELEPINHLLDRQLVSRGRGECRSMSHEHVKMMNAGMDFMCQGPELCRGHVRLCAEVNAELEATDRGG